MKKALLEELDNITWVEKGSGAEYVFLEGMRDNWPPIILDQFHEFMNGQTMSMINGGTAYNVGDVVRFLKGLPNND